jgi:hypothetical protein
MLTPARLKHVAALGNTPGHLNDWSAGGFQKFAERRARVRARRTPLPWTMVLADVHVATCDPIYRLVGTSSARSTYPDISALHPGRCRHGPHTALP